MAMSPGREHSQGRAVMWEIFPLPDEITARRAEKAAHERLSACQLPNRVHSGSDHHGRSEWFSGDIAHVREEVARIAARHADASFADDVPEPPTKPKKTTHILQVPVPPDMLEELDKWRGGQPGIPNRSKAARDLMRMALRANR